MDDPHEQERTLVGSLMLTPERLDDVRDLVAAEDFTDPVAGDMYRHLLAFWDLGIPTADPMLLTSELQKAGFRGVKTPQDATGIVSKFVTKAGAPSNAKFYASDVHERAQYRHLAKIMSDVQKHIDQQVTPIGEVREYLETRLCELTEGGQDQPRLVPDVANERLAEMKAGDGIKTGGIFSGCAIHDVEFGQWFPGELIVLAARPGIGKSKLAEQIANHQSNKGRSVFVVSLEMKEAEWVDRMICTRAEIDNRVIRKCERLNSEEMAAFESAAYELQSSLVTIWSKAGATVPQIRSKARSIKAKAPLSLVVVDYLQRLRHENGKMSPYERVSDNVTQLKNLAQDLSIPVLALCQLNREAEGCMEPTLDHLRESGQIEQEADQVIMLGRDRTRGETNMLIRKHRNAPEGKVQLEFDGITGFSGFGVTGFESFNAE